MEPRWGSTKGLVVCHFSHEKQEGEHLQLLSEAAGQASLSPESLAILEREIAGHAFLPHTTRLCCLYIHAALRVPSSPWHAPPCLPAHNPFLLDLKEGRVNRAGEAGHVLDQLIRTASDEQSRLQHVRSFSIMDSRPIGSRKCNGNNGNQSRNESTDQ